MINRIVLSTWLVIAGTLLFMGMWTVLDLAYENIDALSSLRSVDGQFSRLLPCLAIAGLGIGMHFHRGYKSPVVMDLHRRIGRQ